MLPTIVSFYTKNTSYEKEAEYLIASCKKLELPFEIDGVDSMGTWEENCRFKPSFILDKMKKLKKPLLWIDSDAMILKKPRILSELKGDVGVCIDESKAIDDPTYLFAGTFFLNPTPKALELMNLWVETCTTLQTVWGDQLPLQTVILENKVEAKIDFLPSSYWSFYDAVSDDTLKNETTILHYQASRILKNEINDIKNTSYLNVIQNEERTWRFFHRLSTLHQLGIHDAPTFR